MGIMRLLITNFGVVTDQVLLYYSPYQSIGLTRKLQVASILATESKKKSRSILLLLIANLTVEGPILAFFYGVHFAVNCWFM